MLALGAPARAQVRAPALVEEDLPPEEKRPAAEARPVEPTPPPPKPVEPPPQPQPRAIEPVRATWDGILADWRLRRQALREADGNAARAAAARIVDAKRDLAIDNLFAFAFSEVRESSRALGSRLAADALDHAGLAVQLAPDLADAHLALARAQLAQESPKAGEAAAQVGAAALAVLREPHTVRAFLGDVAAAGLSAVAVAAAVTLLVLFARRARLFFHDFGHLPVVRSATALQAFTLALVLLAIPLAAGLGPWAGLAILAAAAWPYLVRRERLVASAGLAALALLPWAAEGAARWTAWTGTPAEEVFELEHGGDGGELAARMAARDDLPAEALQAVGRFHKRRGDLAAARGWYERAAQKGGRTPSLLVAEGNVKFLLGDAAGAKAAWLEASDHGGAAGTALTAAQYNLSKLYLRQSALEQSQQARRRAQSTGEEFLARHGADDDFRANRWILDAPVEPDRIRALAADDRGPRLAGDAVRARLGASIPRPLWPWAPLAAVALLWLLGPLATRLKASAACERCGRPACARCAAQAGPLCGQCVNVFVRKGVVDARDRLRKEAQVRRHERFSRWAARGLALAGGGAGHVWMGRALPGALLVLGIAFALFLLLFWRGVVPPPHPSPYALLGKAAVAVPLGLALYLLAVRDAFRRTRD